MPVPKRRGGGGGLLKDVLNQVLFANRTNRSLKDARCLFHRDPVHFDMSGGPRR